MSKILTERHRICVEPETTPTSIFSAGSTAYSIVKKIGYLLDKLFEAIKEWLTERFEELSNNINVSVDTYSRATQKAVEDSKQEILEAIKNIDTYEEFDDEDWKEITGEEPEPEPVGDVVAFLCSATSGEEDFRCEFMQETKVGDVTWYVWEDIGPEQHKPEYHFTLMRNPQVGDFCYEGEPAEDESTKQQVTDVFYE